MNPLNLLLKIFLNIFYWTVICPIGFLCRWTGVDPLKRGLSKNARSYWENY